MNVRACQLVFFCLFCWCSALWTQAGDWQPPVPSDNDSDWMQLSSGEWLKGDIIVLYHGKMEFDSQELNLQTLDFEDIEQIRSAQVVQVRLSGGIDLLGQLYMADGRVGIIGAEHSYERSRLLTIAGGEPRETKEPLNKYMAPLAFRRVQGQGFMLKACWVHVETC